jgi:hypothetical protein
MIRSNPEREWLSIKEFKKRNPQLGVNLIYRCCASGELLSIRVAGRVLIASDALHYKAEVN